MKKNPQSERPVIVTTNVNIDHFHHIVMDDRQLTISQITNAISISSERVEIILHNEFDMMMVSAWWMPTLLTPDQKHIRPIISCKNLTLFEADLAS